MIKSSGKGMTAMGESEARKKWSKENTRMFTMKLQHSTDADIIEQLESVDSIQGYIKELIRKDLKRKNRTSKKGD
jgi:hypothetical protein